MAQTMSQMLKLNTVVNVPITVVYRTTPCSWKLERDRRVTIRQHGQFVHPTRFFEADAHTIPKYDDAWSVRERFLQLKTEQDFLDFLRLVACRSEFVTGRTARRCRGGPTCSSRVTTASFQ